MPTHVATTTLSELGWNATALSGDVPTAVAELKAGSGGPIPVAGRATLVKTILAAGLVDELRLVVFPVMIGCGLSIFPTARAQLAFDLTDLVRDDGGVALRVCRPAP